MKIKGFILLTMALMALVSVWVSAGAAQEEPDEWTVLFYLCGSDLESNYRYATGNLEDISKAGYPDDYLTMLKEQYGVEAEKPPAPGKVNILIETGGAKEWHAQELGMEIRTNALQRWQYQYYPQGQMSPEGPYNGFEIMETLPLQNMADPRTLADFIRWGAETRPAKKYALVLWGHGGGAATGLCIDELFDNDVLYLHELRQALPDSGVQLETVVIDACLMSSLETAWSIKDSARWMVASEEVVPGKGTAVSKWLQQLICNPECDGEWLGRTICDTNYTRYTNATERRYKSILTWSVTDLSKIDPLLNACGRFVEAMNEAIRHYPLVAGLYANYIFNAEEYGDGRENMRDVASVVRNTSFASTMDYRVRNDVLDALADAVVYSVRGPGRSEAQGLSFCYPTDYSPKQLEIYAKNFPMPQYLAYLDAITDWEAPAWVYEHTEPVPDIDSIGEFRIKVKKVLGPEGMPGLVAGKEVTTIHNVYYRLYRLDEETGEVIRLGRTDCSIDPYENNGVQYRAADPVHWPSVDGTLFCMDLIQTQYDRKLYNVPVQINSQNCFLRCGREVSYSDDGTKRFSDYVVYGLWEGFEENIDLMNRSVRALSELAGQPYRFLYPTEGQGQNGSVNYQPGPMMTMYRALPVEEILLPAGTYYLEYEVKDMFRRSYLLERIEFHWDGEQMAFPEGFSWEGETELSRKQPGDE